VQAREVKRGPTIQSIQPDCVPASAPEHDMLVSGSRRWVRPGIARDCAAGRGAQIVNQSWLTMVAGYRLSWLWKEAVNRSASSIRTLVTCVDLAPNS
jgi:hypothetical protein